VSRERLRTLEAMYERMVKGLEQWLVSRLRGHVELRLQSVEQFAVRRVRDVAAGAVRVVRVRRAPLGRAQGVIDVGHEFAYFLVDRLFGGSGQSPAPGRTLSPVERLAVRTVAERACQLLEEIWRDHVALDLSVTGFESSPEILQVANREDPVLVANVEVVAGSASSLLLLCLPFGVLEKFFQGGASAAWAAWPAATPSATRPARAPSARCAPRRSR
jgi:flagellar motor switch protein FliM